LSAALTNTENIPTTIEAKFSIVLTQPVKVLSVSNGIDNLLGFKEEAFLNESISLQSLIHRHDQDISDLLFSKQINPASGIFNIRLRHADGRIRCIKAQYTKDLDSSGKLIELDLLLQDAKSLFQKQSDQTMLANFKAMMDRTDDYIYFKDRNHVFTAASQTLVTITDPSENWGDLIGKTDYDVFSEKYADIYYSLEKQIFSGAELAHEVQESLDENGHKGWVDNKKYPIKNDMGEIVGLFGVARDVTEAKQTELALAEFKYILDQTIDCIFMFRNDTFQFTYVNEGSVNQIGYTRAEMLGMTALDIQPDFTVESFLELVALLRNNLQTSVNFQTVHRHKDGHDIPVEVFLQLVRNVESEPRYIAIVRNIKERKQDENQLKLIAKRSQLLLELQLHSEQEDEKTFMQHGQEIAENLTGSLIAFIHFVNEDEETIELVTWSRRTIEHYCHAAFDSHYPVNQAGIWADALRVRSPVMFNDYASYPHKKGLPEGHSPLHRLISVPVIENGKVVMLTGVGNKETDYTESDIETVQLISNNIWSLVQRRRTEHEQRIAATAFESQEPMTVADENGLIIRANSAFTKVTGYTEEEVIGKDPKILKSGRHDKAFYQVMWNEIVNKGSWEGEIWNRRKDGEVYPEYLTITAVKDNDGKVTNYIASFIDITQTKLASEKIKNLAFYDPLTKLPNRRLLSDRLKQALVNTARSHLCGALIFLDLDRFKNLNDTLGHYFGDLLLQEVAERLITCVRKGDSVSRFGGDEFVLLMENFSDNKIDAAKQIRGIANKILSALNEPYKLGTHEYHITASIGVTLFSEHDTELEDLLKQADIAMYEAKNNGRNHLRFFDPKMQELVNQRTDMEIDLRNAVIRNEFQLYYQVQMGSDGVILGVEALIRWHHPKKGVISPLNFVPLAEELGLILPIGLWVLETACAQLKIWEQDPLTRDLDISINVSTKQFKTKDFVKQIKAAVKRYSINPYHLKLEITESMLIDNIDYVVSTMSELNKIGVRFELDDFGTGYSSLQYLKQLPIYRLKIDQSFVRDITTDRSDKALVLAIIKIAHSLDYQVIAEGVETEAQRQWLMDNGCLHYQGYLFSRPLPIDELEALIRKS
jgi:diguanylate cyclase (GGDEF)-like protein/PAS domain S-box-containing protein